ncbi:hypothetical protein ACQHIV_03830 [Kribbella sp. GL6]|uniref:hypothetical protein n=1 Tax=Kribbella sp. GL6 TaxID=3419765 RepID=UPI003D0687EE
MGIKGAMFRGIAALGSAVAVGVLVPPAVSSAAPVEVSAAGRDAAVCVTYKGAVRGCAGFQAKGEYLVVCDRSADGRRVVGQLYWAGKVRASVLDRNGAKKPCYGVNLNIKEGTPVYVRVVVEGVGYSTWVRATA